MLIATSMQMSSATTVVYVLHAAVNAMKEMNVNKISDYKYEMWFSNTCWNVLTKEESALCFTRWVKEGYKL